jgi:hypothetical protein
MCSTARRPPPSTPGLSRTVIGGLAAVGLYIMHISDGRTPFPDDSGFPTTSIGKPAGSTSPLSCPSPFDDGGVCFQTLLQLLCNLLCRLQSLPDFRLLQRLGFRMASTIATAAIAVIRKSTPPRMPSNALCPPPLEWPVAAPGGAEPVYSTSSGEALTAAAAWNGSACASAGVRHCPDQWHSCKPCCTFYIFLFTM